MSKLNRRPGEPLQVPLYKLKAYYELLLGISFPQMEADTATIRSDSYAANCSKFFISKNTGVAVSNYVHLKMQKGENINVVSICQVVGRHEANNPTDQIQAVQYLPEHATSTRLDTQMSVASNVEELFIASTKLDRNRGYESRDRNSSRGNSKSPARSHNGRDVKTKDGFRKYSYWKSPGGSSYFRGKSPSGKNNSTETRSTTPHSNSGQRRNQSNQRFTSKGGRYEKSPGRTTWRRYSKSPTPRRRYNQDNRGRQGQNTSNSVPRCIRCGKTHESNDCRTYDYW